MSSNKIKEYTEKSNRINENIENHKKEISKIDFNNYTEAMNTIRDIRTKLNNDKKDLTDLINDINKEKQKLNDNEEKSNKKNMLVNGLAAAGCVAGTILTGGLLAVAFGTAAAVNGVAIGINHKESEKIKEKEEFYNNKIEELKQQQNKINNILKDLNEKYVKFQNRFI